MFTIDSKYGHQTLDGREAKYLGKTEYSHFSFLINDLVYSIGYGGLPLFGSMAPQIVNKPAPSKWYNLYFRVDPTMSSQWRDGGGHSSQETAKRWTASPPGYVYVATVEVKG